MIHHLDTQPGLPLATAYKLVSGFCTFLIAAWVVLLICIMRGKR